MKRILIYFFTFTIILFSCNEAATSVSKPNRINTSAANKSNTDSDAPLKVSLNISLDDEASSTTSSDTTDTTTIGETREDITTISTEDSTESSEESIETRNDLNNNNFYECPKDSEAEFVLMPTTCTSNKECKVLGANQICCKVFGDKRCVEGKVVEPQEQKHQPLLFIIPQKCPKRGETLAETWWPIKTCDTDRECWPRLCCPDGDSRYCMAPQPDLKSFPLPVGRQLASPIEQFSQYMQCTPPPPKAFDPHPKKCNNMLDCFPNLCCLEAGNKFCRPPKRSLLTLLTGFGQRFTNISFIRDWSENLVIR